MWSIGGQQRLTLTEVELVRRLTLGEFECSHILQSGGNKPLGAQEPVRIYLKTLVEAARPLVGVAAA
jgi:hypothetical protein